MNSSAGSATGPDFEQATRHVPEQERTTDVSSQFWIWAGANIAPINWVLGALGIQLGLSLQDTLIVLVAGNLIGMAGFGVFVLLGQKAGVTGMVLSRGPFGRRGAYLPAAIQACLAIGWCAVNTWIVLDLVMALFGRIGLVDPLAANIGWRIGVAAVIMAIQVAISWAGYRAIAAFERWTVPPTVLVLIVMSVAAWFFIGVDWSYAGPPGEILTGTERLAAMSGVMTAIGIGWGITWYTYAADYSRFVSSSMPRRRLYLASVLGQFIPVVWLGVLGASLATRNGTIDPGQLIVENFGALAIPVLLLVVHGPIATNILNIYTFSVAVQAMDVKISRRTLSVGVGSVAMAAVVVFVFTDDLATVLDTWLVGIVAWIASWAGVMAVHYFVIERGPIDADRLLAAPARRRLPAFNGPGLIAFALGVLATWLFLHGEVAALQGPVSTALGGLDLSWLAGSITSATCYFVLARRRTTAPPPAPAERPRRPAESVPDEPVSG